MLGRILLNQIKPNGSKFRNLFNYIKLPFISKGNSQINSIKSNKLIISNYFSFSNKSMEQTKLDNKEAMLKFLSDAKVEIHHIEDHEELKTVNEGIERLKSVNFEKGNYSFLKNLFLKNKAGGFFLLSAHHVK